MLDTRMDFREGGKPLLQGSELEAIMDASPWAVAVVNAEMRYLLCSKNWTKQLGLEGQDLKGLNHNDLFPIAQEQWDQRHKESLGGKVLSLLEPAVLQPDATEEWLRWDVRPWTTSTGTVGGLVLRYQIVTQERTAELELKQSNQRLEEAQRLSRIGYWDWQLEDNSLSWSREVYDLFGVDPERRPLTYTDYFSAVPAEEQEQVAGWVSSAIEAAEPFYFEHRIVRPDGQQRHVAIDGRIEKGPDGRALRLIGAAQDVTERHALEEQLRQVQKMDSVGRLAGGVAHDFNNILTAVFSFADLAREHLEQAHPAHSDIQEILDAAVRAKSLTQQLLAFSRQKTVSPRVVNVNERVSNIEAMMRRILGEDIAYSTHLTDDLWHTRIDPGALEQVVVNLAVNARDAMPGGGRLTLETANVTLGDAETSAKGHRIPAGEYVAFVISDDGQGMEPEVRDRIFDPFYTTKGPGHGTGLGLSTCYGIIRQACGYMWVYSEPGHGSTFKVYLPRVLDALEQEETSTLPAASLGGQELVLVAEDNPKVRVVTARVLQAHGYTVILASSGEEALELVQDGQLEVDLLLTDVVMPGMTGKELADRLVEHRPEAKVLFMSGYTENTIVHHGVLEKGIELLQKPFDPLSLSERVRQVLDHSVAWTGVTPNK